MKITEEKLNDLAEEFENQIYTAFKDFIKEECDIKNGGNGKIVFGNKENFKNIDTVDEEEYLSIVGKNFNHEQIYPLYYIYEIFYLQNGECFISYFDENNEDVKKSIIDIPLEDLEQILNCLWDCRLYGPLPF